MSSVGSAVAALVLEIQLVRELVEHEVLAIGWLGRAVANRVPRQHQSAESFGGVAESVFAAFLPDATADVALLVRGVAGRVDDDGDQLGVVIGFAMKQEQARLSRDRDANFIGQIEPARALEIFLRKKYLHMPEEFFLIRCREAAEDGKIPLEDCAPRRWNRLRAEPCAAAGLK